MGDGMARKPKVLPNYFTAAEAQTDVLGLIRSIAWFRASAVPPHVPGGSGR